MAIRRKCFISYFHEDQDEVDAFVQKFDEDKDVFITKGVGIGDDDIIDSEDKNYIMRRIREKHLVDSTVTIVLLGRCTWTRRYVDWEIASTLRNDANNKRSGLLAIDLPSRAGKTTKLPDRFKDNGYVSETGKGYAKWYKYPSSADKLAAWIEDAFDARDSRADQIDNTRDLFKNNRTCD